MNVTVASNVIFVLAFLAEFLFCFFYYFFVDVVVVCDGDCARVWIDGSGSPWSHRNEITHCFAWRG